MATLARVTSNWAGEWGGTEVAFGEQGARLTYGSYLHQVYELWFQQLLHEAGAARDAMLDATVDRRGQTNRLWWAQHLLERMHVIERVLVQQVDVLETMTPQDFLQFRQSLAPASGFQSVQFRELEFLSGAKDPSFVGRFKGLTESETERLRRRLDEPSLWDAFLHVLRERGLDTEDDAAVTRSVRRAAHDRASYSDVWALAESLLQHDELAASWRARHVVMVERMIGTKTGTGGSSGAEYLRSRLGLRYYPLLWGLRSHL
jgi:tryptophan 2,3-dioxygenase